jgi:hypothetical protein
MLTLAVLFVAPWAYAQGEGHCVTEPMTVVSASVLSQPLPSVKTPAKDLSWAVSRIIEQAHAAAPRPGQSRPLVMCLDPHQPGCQIDLPDVPQRHGSLHLFWDAARATLSFEGLPPAPEGAPIVGVAYDGGPREGFARPWLRPPAV